MRKYGTLLCAARCRVDVLLMDPNGLESVEPDAWDICMGVKPRYV